MSEAKVRKKKNETQEKRNRRKKKQASKEKRKKKRVIKNGLHISSKKKKWKWGKESSEHAVKATSPEEKKRKNALIQVDFAFFCLFVYNFDSYRWAMLPVFATDLANGKKKEKYVESWRRRAHTVRVKKNRVLELFFLNQWLRLSCHSYK